MPKLMIVLPGKYLHLPPEVDPDGELWLPPGGVLDFDDEYVRHACKGQEYKLDAAPPEITAASPITNRRMVLLREEFHGRAAPTIPDDQAAREEGAERAASEGVSGGIEKPRIERPRKNKPNTEKAPTT